MKPKSTQTPHQKFFVKNLTDSAIELAVRPWAKEDYGAVLLKH
jgi:small conductance mechanosensitive channel